jgi:hypothetical protein
LNGSETRVAEVRNVAFPKLLDPIDDLPPVSVITHVIPIGKDTLRVRGTCSDNGVIAKVMVNEVAAKALRPNFAEWEATLTGTHRDVILRARATDTAGNVEPTPHAIGYRWK